MSYRPRNIDQNNDGVVGSTYIRGSVPNGVVSRTVNGVPQDVRSSFSVPSPVSTTRFINGVVPPVPVSSARVGALPNYFPNSSGLSLSELAAARGLGAGVASRDQYGRTPDTGGFGRGAAGSSTRDPYGRTEDTTGFGRDLTDAQMNWEENSKLDREWGAILAALGLNEDGTPINGRGSGGGGGGGGGGRIDYTSALNNLMMSGLFDAVPAPTLQAGPAPLQMAATQLPQFQQWNPQMLAAPDFSGQYGNIDTLAQQTRGQIDAAFAPALAALSTQIPSSIGAVAGTAQNVDPGLQAFAESQGVGAGYAADLAAANQGIQSNADLFSGRNQMMDRVFQQNRANTADIARQSEAGALSNVATQQMLATAALDQIAQQAAIQNSQYNNQLMNNAGQLNSQGLNNWALTQAGFDNEANVANTNALNAWLQGNTDIANQNAMLGFEGDTAANNNRLQAILNLIAEAGAAKAPIDLSAVLGMVA